MAAILCPNCNKSNPDGQEICQFCGTPLKNRNTEPLPTIRPGEMPVKQQTSELESTLPSWLRDMRKGDSAENAPTAAQPAKPETPAPLVSPDFGAKNVGDKGSDSPLDFLAGLSQANDEEEAVPDWLAGLKADLPSQPPPAAEVQPQEPIDWLAGLEGGSKPQSITPEQSSSDWAFNNDADEPAAPVLEETPDWLAALKAQDTSVNAPAQPKPAEFFPADTDSSSDSLPDWLNSLAGTPASSAPAPEIPSPTDDLADMPGWLSDMTSDSVAAVQPVEQATPPISTPTPSDNNLPPAGDFPDWLANLGNESISPAQLSQSVPVTPSAPVPPSDDLSSGGNLPDWLAGLTNESPKAPAVETPSNTPASIFDNHPTNEATLPDWLGAAVEEKPPEKPLPPPSAAKKAFSTGALQELGSLGQPDQVPDWMAGLGSPTPAKTPEPASPSAAPEADTFDWLSGLNQAGTSPVVTESKPTGQPESTPEKAEAAPVSFDISAPEDSTSALTPDSGNTQSLDSIFSMEMPDWLSGFTPSEPEPAARTASEQPGPSTGSNISPADLPSWVQAMRPIESVMSGAEGGNDDQTVEKEGPLAGLRSVLPALTNAPGQRKPKAYSIKLQVDSTQMAQATLLENLIASEAESRPVSTPKRIVNIRPLRWIIAALLLVAILITAVAQSEFFPLPVLANSETEAFYKLVNALPDAAPVLVVFDYQPAYAGEMEQIAGPVIDHLMIKNARLAFVSTSPMGVLMSERIMADQNKRRVGANPPESTYDIGLHYIDLGYLPGDAAGIQVFAETPRILGNDYKRGNLWTPDSGFENIQTLSSFEITIVLTDNPDTGRIWIEQTGQALHGKPMLMVVSAQAAPMIRPYYPKQVQGMVSGLAGGALYEATNQRAGGNATIYWDSYGAGMIAAEVLIVSGAIWALIEYLRMRRTEQAQEEDEA